MGRSWTLHAEGQVGLHQPRNHPAKGQTCECSLTLHSHAPRSLQTIQLPAECHGRAPFDGTWNRNLSRLSSA